MPNRLRRQCAIIPAGVVGRGVLGGREAGVPGVGGGPLHRSLLQQVTVVPAKPLMLVLLG